MTIFLNFILIIPISSPRKSQVFLYYCRKFVLLQKIVYLTALPFSTSPNSTLSEPKKMFLKEMLKHIGLSGQRLDAQCSIAHFTSHSPFPNSMEITLMEVEITGTPGQQQPQLFFSAHGSQTREVLVLFTTLFKINQSKR